ncbi:EscJ/YscJ/HrcJ family type III secretion inner membrane ring protein [Exilibacterium tricleocarpae]|uniref:Lipoprotein n=1 Tax=Exilibacterium tricleocarpae TaxID=2591008 RepID=A0A545U3K8_9GAMM|nr:type III secretion inner membrane ring lipoprotein SctJ [Exilibacterium tricleocarpae]TQV84065.1 EscJ/YscJ/HrcJ family type III secretion inner membrane ring protein [Exilibacterium tricleocarpae]
MRNSQKGLLKATLFLFFLLISGCKTVVDLHTELNEKDANEVVAALLSKGIGAKKVRRKEGLAVLIDEADMARAVNLLSAQALPRRHKTSMGEIFKKEGVISTPLEERARYIYALSQELELTLNEMDGVIAARVHVVLPERIAPGEPINPSSAAVFIKHEESYDVDIYTARIKQLIASSIPGLVTNEADKIAIVYSVSEKKVIETEWTMLGPYKMEVSSAERLSGTMKLSLLLIPVMFLLYILIPNEKPRRWFFSKIGANAIGGRRKPAMSS